MDYCCNNGFGVNWCSLKMTPVPIFLSYEVEDPDLSLLIQIDNACWKITFAMSRAELTRAAFPTESWHLFLIKDQKRFEFVRRESNTVVGKCSCSTCLMYYWVVFLMEQYSNPSFDECWHSMPYWKLSVSSWQCAKEFYLPKGAWAYRTLIRDNGIQTSVADECRLKAMPLFLQRSRHSAHGFNCLIPQILFKYEKNAPGLWIFNWWPAVGSTDRAIRSTATSILLCRKNTNILATKCPVL